MRGERKADGIEFDTEQDADKDAEQGEGEKGDFHNATRRRVVKNLKI